MKQTTKLGICAIALTAAVGCSDNVEFKDNESNLTDRAGNTLNFPPCQRDEFTVFGRTADSTYKWAKCKDSNGKTKTYGKLFGPSMDDDMNLHDCVKVLSAGKKVIRPGLHFQDCIKCPEDVAADDDKCAHRFYFLE